MFDIINVIDFFQETKSKKDYNNYEALKNLIINSDSQFIHDCVLLALYGYVKPLEIPFNTFISNKDVLLFLSSYENKTSSLTELYEEEFSKLESFLFKDINFIKNTFEIIPYLVVEAMVEYKTANKKFIPSSKNQTQRQSIIIQEEIFDLKTGKNNLSFLNDKPYGYYITEIKADPYSNYYSGSKYQIISNQEEGFKIYDLDSCVSQVSGFRNNALNFSDLFRKEHNLQFELIEAKEKELQIHVNENKNKNIYNSFINELVFKTFVYFADLEQGNVNNIAYLGYQNNLKGSKNFPSLITNQSKEMPYFSFEDLLFSGEYQFLSFLDDWFKDILDLNLVNYYSEEINSIHFFEQRYEKELYKQKKLMNFDNIIESCNQKIEDKFQEGKVPYFSKEYCNDLEIKIVNEQSFLNSQERDGYSLTPINPYFFGSEDEMKDYAFKIAKANKLKLYAFYINAFIKTFSKKFNNEMKSFLQDNILDLMEDEEFLYTLQRVGVANASSRNWSELGRNNASVSILVNDEDVYNENDNFYSSFKNIDDIKFTDYKGKVKGTQWITFHCRNLNTLSIMEDKYYLKSSLSKESQFFVKLFESYHSLKKLCNIKNIKENDNLFRFRDLGFDIELYNWFYFEILANIIVPMSKGNKDKLLGRLEQNNVESINCNFGYSNGSKSYY